MRAWRRAAAPLLAVLVIAVGLRLVFAVGFVSGFPQDDGIYINLARSIAHGQLDLGHYRTIPPDFVANPAETFTFRTAYIYVLGLFFRLFGEGDQAAVWPALLASLLGIAVTAALTSELFGARAGWFAAALMATLPHDILGSTRVLADAPLGTFVAAAVLALMIGWKAARPAGFALCGLMLGLAYLIKDTGLLVFVLIAPLVAGYALLTRRWTVFAAYGGGFLSCMVIEGVWYQVQTGHFFLHPFIIRSVTIHKYTREVTTTLLRLPFFRVDWVEDFFFIGPVLFGFTGETSYQFSGFGLTYWVIAIGLLWAARHCTDRRVIVLLTLVLLLYLYVELGPVAIAFEHGTLIYRGIYKHLRYMSLVTPLAMPFAGLVLARLWRYHRGLAVVTTLVVVASGVPSLVHDYAILRGSQNDLRVAAAFLKPLNATVYTDYLAVSSLQYHSGNRDGGTRFRNIQEIEKAADLHDSFVVLGGSRGIEVLSEYALQIIPPWARDLSGRPTAAPPSWHRLFTVEGPKGDMRRHDLVIFKVE